MAIIRTYPLKNNYYGADRLVISDMQPDDQGVVHGETKSLTLSNLKSFIGSQVLSVSVSTDPRYAGAFVSSSTGNVKVGINISSLPNLTASNVDGADKLIINSSQDNKKIRINELFETVGLATNSLINYSVKLPNSVGGPNQILQLPSTIGASPYQLEWTTPAGSGTVIGTGTVGRIPKWQSTTGLDDSVIFQLFDKIGIGTTGPGAKLHVDGTSGTTQAIIGYGTQNLYVEVNGTNVDLKSSGNSAGSFSFSTGNNERVRIASTGNVGIGTTNPLVALQVNNTSPKVRFLDTSDFFYTEYGRDGIDAYSNTNGTAPIFFKTGGVEKIRITSTGSLGIGTTAPGEKLEVTGKIKATGTADVLQLYRNSSSQANYIKFYDNATSSPEFYLGFTSNNRDFQISNLASTGTIALRSGGGNTMILDSDQKVGIGTTTPAAQGLEVANMSLVNGGNTELFITGNSNGRSILGLGDSSNNIVQHIISHHTDNSLSFHTAATSVTNNEKMRITSGGNVGIGTTAPNYKLDVNGNFRAKGITSSTTHTVTIEAATGWYRIMQWSGASRGGAIVKLSTTGGNVAPTTYVINAYKTYGNPASSNTLKLEQYGNNSYLTKARIATDSVTSVTYVEIYNAFTSANYTMEVYHDSLLGLDSLTSVLTGTLETGPNSVSQEELPFVHEGTTTEKSSSELVTLIGDGTNDGKLRFNCSANSHYVEIVGPNHSGGSSYSLKLPNSLPNVSAQVLQSNASGVLSWIPTPSGGGSGGGTITSVGLTMPSAFSVTNSPLSGTGGTISVGLTGGSAGQYLDYQGNWSRPAFPNPSAPSATTLVALSINGTVYGVPQGTGNGTITGVSGQNGISGSGTSGSVALSNSDRGSSQLFYRTFTPDNGTDVVASTNQDTMLIKGGAGITTSGSGDQITIVNNQATNTERGGVKLFTSTVQSVNATGVSSTAGRTYGVQLNNSGQAVVNVPWTSGSGGGISFSGNTADGLATYSSSTTAAVSSDVRLRNNFMTFDGSSEGTGVDFYSSGATSILRFGDMTGDTASFVELWADGSRRFQIGVNGEIGLGTGASQGTSGQVLTSQGNGSPATWSSSSGQNIANTNLTQTANRTYAMGTYALTMTGSSTVSMQNTNGLVVNGNIISNSQSYAAKNSISNQNSNFTIDFNNGNVQQVNLTNGTGTVVISFSNIRAGARYTVITTRLGYEGSYGFYSFNSVLWPNNSAPQNVPAGTGTFNMYEFVATTNAASGMLGYFFRNYQTAS